MSEQDKIYVDTDGAANILVACEDAECGWQVNAGLAPSVGKIAQLALAHQCGKRHV